MNLKVLTNDLQHCLEGALFKHRRKTLDDDSDELLDGIIGTDKKRFPAVFNRVGFYLLDNRTAWYEFKLPSGRFVGVSYDKSWFDFQLSNHNADENAISDADWKMIQHLITKGVLKWDERWNGEEYRRQRRRQHIDMSRRLLAFRKRVKAKIEEKKNGL